MAVREKTEIIDLVKARLGDDTGDEAIALIEDLNDTIDHLESSAGEDWKARYEANDAEWRKKYMDRFCSAPPDEDQEGDEGNEKPRTFADLFKTE